MIVIVTGSRNWVDPARIYRELDALYFASPATDPFTLKHGGHPRGADAHAAAWAERTRAKGWVVGEEAFPVTPEDWNRYGPGAGPRRNGIMVTSGADLCLAFIARCTKPGPCLVRRQPRPKGHGSHGATDCATRAIAALIETTARAQR